MLMNFDNLSVIGENATHVVDVSGSGNNGTLVNGTSWTASGRYGDALEFDGINDYLRVRNEVNLTDYTVSFWFYYTENQSNVIFHRGRASEGCIYEPSISLVNDTLNTYISGCGGAGFIGGGSVSKNEWNHMALTVNSTSQVLFINGAQVASDNQTPFNFGINLNVSIGSIVADPLYNTDLHFKGSIDEVRVWNRSLSGSEISQQYKGNLNKFGFNDWGFYSSQTGLPEGAYTYQAFAANGDGSYNQTDERTYTVDITGPLASYVSPTPSNDSYTATTSIQVNISSSDGNGHSVFLDWNRSLVGRWSFEDVLSNGTVYDDSSYGYNAVMRGFTSNTTGTGYLGSALSFDGVDDYVDTGTLLPDIYDTFTMELWVNPEDTHQIDAEASTGTLGTAGQKYAIFPIHGSNAYGAGHATAGISVGTNGISVYEHAGVYLVTGTLSDPLGTLVVSCTEAKTFMEGETALTLQFNGSTIREKGLNGPYYLAVKITDSSQTTVIDNSSLYSTASYQYTSFQTKPVSSFVSISNGSTGVLVNTTDVAISVTANENSTALVGLTAKSYTTSTSINTTSVSSSSANVDTAIKYLEITNLTTLANLSRIRLQVPYTDSEVAGIDESSLAILYWDGTSWLNTQDYIGMNMTPSGPYVYDAGNDPVANFVYADVNHFSKYSLAGNSLPKGSGSGDVDYGISLDEIIIPDHMVPGSTVKLVLEIGSKVYTRMGATVVIEGLPSGWGNSEFWTGPLTEGTNFVEIILDIPSDATGAYALGLEIIPKDFLGTLRKTINLFIKETDEPASGESPLTTGPPMDTEEPPMTQVEGSVKWVDQTPGPRSEVEEGEKGICGPTLVAIIGTVPLLFRRRRHKTSP